MRAFLLAIVALAAGCSDDRLAEDTTYRRLVDSFDSYDHCLDAGDFAVCYQTLTLCRDGLARIDLFRRPESGAYALEGDAAVAKFNTMTVIFDLESATSNQLPGRHRWDLVMPELSDCTQ